MSETKLHILFLSSWYPSKAHNSLGNFVQRHAETVATMHRVQVLYVAALPTCKGIETEQFEEKGVRTTIVYFPPGRIRLWRKWRAFRHGLRMLQVDGKLPFNLVHLNVIWPAAWQALYIRSKWHIPFVITEHWTGYDQKERPYPGQIVEWLSRMAVRKARVVCPVSKDLGNCMRQFGLRGKYHPVPNVVNTDLFHATKKPPVPVQFLHVSSLYDPQKNISGLLRSWKEAVAQNPAMVLNMGGDGPWREWQAKAESMEIPKESIAFFGELPWEGVAEKMQQSHALVLFSNFENLPCVIVEALASGMVVVSTNVGGISEHINTERGFLIPRRDEKALADVLVTSAKNISSFDPEKLRAYAVTFFSIPSVAQQFDEVYRIALHSKRSQQ